MSQQSQWQIHNSQPIAGGVKMFDPSQFAGTSQASNVNQQNYSQHSAASPQTSAYEPYSTAQTFPDSTQNQQVQNNSWTSWGSWGEGNSVTGNQSYSAHSRGEASAVHTSQAQQDYSQSYWDPNTQQQIQHGQNFQTDDGQQQNHHHQQYQHQQQTDQQYSQYTSKNQWQGYPQNQNMIQTSQHNLYNDHQYQQNTTQMSVGLEQSGDQQQNPHPDQYNSYLGDSFQPSNFPPQTVSPNSTGNTGQGSEHVDNNSFEEENRNSAYNNFNNSDLSNSTNVPFQSTNVTANQFLNTNNIIHRTDSAISNASLCTEGSANTSLDQDQILQQMSGQLQNVSLEPLPEVTSNQPSQTVVPDQTSVEDVKLEEDQQSPLNDWEFVNSIPSSSSQHSRQSSLENSSNILTSQPSPQPFSDIHHTENKSESYVVTSIASLSGGNETQHSTVPIDPFNVNISASFNTETSNSAFSSSVNPSSSSFTTSEPSSLGTSFTNPQTSDFSPPKAPPKTLETSPAASNPFRKPSPQPTKPDAEKRNSPLIPTPIFHPLILSQDSTKDTNEDDLQEQSVSKIPFSGQESTKTENKAEEPKSDKTLKSPAKGQSVPGDQKREDIGSSKDSSKPPIPKDTPQNSPRKHNSAFKPVHRAKHNMSPATSLWDDYSPPKITGVILAPAAPSVTEASPVSKSRSSSPVRSSARESKKRDGEGKGSDSEGYSDNSRSRYRDRRLGSWKKDDDNRSLDSLDEVNSKLDAYRERRYREKYAGRHSYYDERDRPMSRSDYREDYRARYRDDPYYRSYADKDYYGNEKYDRPRSRNTESQEREISETDHQRSRTDYDRDSRDYYRDRYRGYQYDARRRHDDRYSYDDYLYTQAYYDEYYGNQGYGARYNDYYRSQYTVGDNYSHVSNSPRAQTPALDETEPSYDSQGRLSRPSSRQDYGESSYKQDHYDPRYSQYYDHYGYDPYYQGYAYDPYANYHDTSYSRLTPPKYSIPHMKACFGPNGQLIKVLPNRPADGQPAVVEVQEVESVLADTTGAEEVKEFPGPLIRGDTHKNDILLFCQRKAKKCAEEINMMDRESAELIWKLLELLIKQNGTVIGTDIADLLLEGHEPTTKEYSMGGMKIASSLENIQLAEDTDLKTTVDKTTINNKTRDDLIDRFRHLLLYGRKKVPVPYQITVNILQDALEWAMKNSIWGHALFLASKMDTRTHANVMTKFANSAMKMNDPLQSLYQLMSGRQPAAVTPHFSKYVECVAVICGPLSVSVSQCMCMSDERWGDWRPHLAMILSNHTSKSDIDRKSITTLGDTLAAKGCLHASHFCYLMAQVNFGVFTKKTSKIVLIGSSHNLSLDEFATNEAIQCTEIYEYAMSLGNTSFVLPHLQVFKFIYACRLAEYGLSEETLRYCEVISQNIQRSPVYYQPSFVKSLYELSNRLKYHDPARQHEGDDAEDAIWLQHLSVVCHGYDDGSIQPISGTATPAGYPGTTTSSDSGEVAEYTSNTYNTNQYQNYQQDCTYTDSNQQYDQSQNQYNQGQGQYDQGQGYYQNQYQQTGSNNVTSETTDQQTEGQTTDYLHQLQAYNAEWNQYTQQQGYYTENQQQTTDTTNNQSDTSQNTGYTQPPQGYYQPTGSENQQQGYYNPQQARNSISSTQSLPKEEDDDDDDDDEEDDDQADGGNHAPPPGSFDYFGAATSQKIVAPPSRFRADSTSSTGIPPRQRTTSGSSTGSLSAANPKPKTKQNQKNEQQKNNEKGGGWLNMFGWGKNKPKQKKHKEIILPDDKNPKIVWDPVNKKWTNQGGEEETSTPAAPPPKDIDLMGKSSGMNGSAPPMMSGANGTNRFSLKSAGGARNQYVDVLKSDSSPVSTTSLLNTAPSINTNTNIYNPSAGSSQVNDKQSLDIPPSSQNISRSSSRSSLSREVEELTDLQKNQSINQTASSMPVLFDPNQFQQSTATTQPNTSQGMKYGQRRKYPK
ncbi:hypothetical protein LOTGIDRAFT_231137 [Lottia gigantea]|uniref:Protein transport protein sec16 n=1 Tax=Lottia gigantea TaxID=225164 RepID=V4A470_LOTGI|nr:hypothetical protein LOTGIDRAFT_231137 [Lottia gigantea]ESO98713.1 hypothetical protein LOTGIDRAFT_231137 [Lottia gigantea]